MAFEAIDYLDVFRPSGPYSPLSTSATRRARTTEAWLRRAYSEAGLEPPTVDVGAAFFAALDKRTRPFIDSVRGIADRVVAGEEDVDALADEVCDRIVASGVSTTTSGVTGVRALDALKEEIAMRRESALYRLLDDAAKDLRPHFRKVVKRLTAAAEALPLDARNPLDPRALVDAGPAATAAAFEAKACLESLSTIALRGQDSDGLAFEAILRPTCDDPAPLRHISAPVDFRILRVAAGIHEGWEFHLADA